MKKVVYSGIVILASVLFSGCGSSFNGYSTYKPINPNSAKLTTAVSGADGMTMLTSTMKNRAAFRVFQATVEQTLANGDGYFTIMFPVSVSNANGSLMNSGSEFIKECADVGSLEVIVNERCNGLVNNINWGRLQVMTYKKRPSDVVVYDAQESLSQIKSNEYFDKLAIGSEADAPNFVKPWLK